MFDATFEAVLGAKVASHYGLKIGDEIVTSHGLAEHGTEHAASPLTVVGILKTTHTAYDNAVFTGVETVWAVHGHEEEGQDHEEGEEHDHAEESEVCAVLVHTKGFNDYFQLMADYGADANLLAINPATVAKA
jgi:putative ABC transport system permease protein